LHCLLTLDASFISSHFTAINRRYKFLYVKLHTCTCVLRHFYTIIIILLLAKLFIALTVSIVMLNINWRDVQTKKCCKQCTQVKFKITMTQGLNLNSCLHSRHLCSKYSAMANTTLWQRELSTHLFHLGICKNNQCIIQPFKENMLHLCCVFYVWLNCTMTSNFRKRF